MLRLLSDAIIVFLCPALLKTDDFGGWFCKRNPSTDLCKPLDAVLCNKFQTPAVEGEDPDALPT